MGVDIVLAEAHIVPEEDKGPDQRDRDLAAGCIPFAVLADSSSVVAAADKKAAAGQEVEIVAVHQEKAMVNHRRRVWVPEVAENRRHHKEEALHLCCSL